MHETILFGKFAVLVLKIMKCLYKNAMSIELASPDSRKLVTVNDHYSLRDSIVQQYYTNALSSCTHQIFPC